MGGGEQTVCVSLMTETAKSTGSLHIDKESVDWYFCLWSGRDGTCSWNKNQNKSSEGSVCQHLEHPKPVGKVLIASSIERTTEIH